MNKLLLVFGLGLAASAYGSTLTATTACTPFSGPAAVVSGSGGCQGGDFEFTVNSSGFTAAFNLFPSAYIAGGCQNPVFESGCGVTEIAVDFSDDIYFDQTGIATFYLDRFSDIPGNPFGQAPDGMVDGQSWSSGIVQVAVSPGSPVHIAFSADWIGQCCAGGPDDGSVELRLSRIDFTDLSGNVHAVTYDAINGVTYGNIDTVLAPEPASIVLSALGFGILVVLRRRKLGRPA